jgi:hypothetical protein
VGDYGPADIFGYGANSVPEIFTNIVLLTHNGQFARGQFRPGHDVVLPPIQSGATGFDPKFSPLFGGVPQEERDTVLFFAGGANPILESCRYFQECELGRVLRHDVCAACTWASQSGVRGTVGVCCLGVVCVCVRSLSSVELCDPPPVV